MTTEKGGLKYPFKTIRNIVTYSPLEKRLSRNDPYPLSPTPSFSTSTSPSSLTQHLVLVKTDPWISRIKSTCREHFILGTTSLNYLGLFTSIPYREKARHFANAFIIHTSQHHSNPILCPPKDQHIHRKQEIQQKLKFDPRLSQQLNVLNSSSVFISHPLQATLAASWQE